MSEETDWSKFQDVMSRKLESFKDDGTVEGLSSGIMGAIIAGLEEGVGRIEAKKPPVDMVYTKDVTKVMNE